MSATSSGFSWNPPAFPCSHGPYKVARPPEPDILCQLEDGAFVAFELGELSDQDFRQGSATREQSEQLLERLFFSLPATERRSIAGRYSDAFIWVHPGTEALTFAEQVGLQTAHPARVDLQLLARCAVSDWHGRSAAAKGKLGDCEPMQRRVGYLHAMTQQEFAQLRQPQSLREPLRDPLAMRLAALPGLSVFATR